MIGGSGELDRSFKIKMVCYLTYIALYKISAVQMFVPNGKVLYSFSLLKHHGSRHIVHISLNIGYMYVACW